MRVIATKNAHADKYDQLKFVRDDGSSSSIAMPRQGILPHDLIHYVVESQLPFQFGFLRQVVSGADAGFVMEEIHDVTNPNVSVEAVQVEAIVEALQTQLWSGVFDQEMFLYAVEMACSARATAAPVWQDEGAKRLLFQRALELATEWQAVPVSSAFELMLA
ncbi:MAG: hypothetical protein HY253_06875 [Burkholderiales bacterium]|nr:hypothetical protein [Burkholderiales bacterium]